MNIIGTFSSKSVCVLVAECGEGMRPRHCGVACQNTCEDPYGIACAIGASCEPTTCYCDDGLVYAGNGTCHSKEECQKCTVPHDGSTKVIQVMACKCWCVLKWMNKVVDTLGLKRRSLTFG